MTQNMIPLADANTDLLVRNARNAQKRAQETKALEAKTPNLKKIETAALDFEASFVTEMLKPMFEGIKADPMFGGGKGEEIFNGLMVDQYGKMVAERGGIGIADKVKSELLRLQESKNGNT